jgi:thiosulfate reductase cytochrome b subunit
LVNKHFKRDFEDVNDAKKFMNDLSEEELQKIRQNALNTFETNMRLLYTLNPEDNH